MITVLLITLKKIQFNHIYKTDWWLWDYIDFNINVYNHTTAEDTYANMSLHVFSGLGPNLTAALVSVIYHVHYLTRPWLRSVTLLQHHNCHTVISQLIALILWYYLLPTEIKHMAMKLLLLTSKCIPLTNEQLTCMDSVSGRRAVGASSGETPESPAQLWSVPGRQSAHT